jgi:hypothetical protein
MIKEIYKIFLLNFFFLFFFFLGFIGLIFFIFFFLIFLCSFFYDYFLFNNYEFLNIIIAHFKINKILLNNFFFPIDMLNFFFKNLFIFIIKIKYFLKTFLTKMFLKKHFWSLKFVFKTKGPSDFFAPFFFKPTLYRFFCFYCFFIFYYIALDWFEHFIDSIDKNESDFEVDFDAFLFWEEDPLVGRNFFFDNQRISADRISEQPDFYKINNLFFQSKKSKFNFYNREFLGGPVFLNIFNILENHETFHQVGTYEFFGPSFIVINVSYETDLEFDFFFIKRFFFYFMPSLNFFKIFSNWKNRNNFFSILNYSILYAFSFIIIIIKFSYFIYLKKKEKWIQKFYLLFKK